MTPEAFEDKKNLEQHLQKTIIEQKANIARYSATMRTIETVALICALVGYAMTWLPEKTWAIYPIAAHILLIIVMNAINFRKCHSEANERIHQCLRIARTLEEIGDKITRDEVHNLFLQLLKA